MWFKNKRKSGEIDEHIQILRNEAIRMSLELFMLKNPRVEDGANVEFSCNMFGDTKRKGIVASHLYKSIPANILASKLALPTWKHDYTIIEDGTKIRYNVQNVKEIRKLKKKTL